MIAQQFHAVLRAEFGVCTYIQAHIHHTGLYAQHTCRCRISSTVPRQACQGTWQQ